MPTMIQKRRSGERAYSTLAALALLATMWFYAESSSDGPWWTGILGGLSAIATIRCTVRATMHRWSREAAAALARQTRPGQVK